MADGLNRCTLIGNLGADPELHFTQGGQAVLHIRLATSESYLDRDKVRQERVDWHNVTVWGKRGEALAKILKKGSSIYVEGPIRTSSYDDRDGVKRYKTEINATKVILGGGRGGDSRDDGEEQEREPARGQQQRSYGSQGSQSRAQQPAAPADDDDGGGYGGDDDIPF